MVVLDIDNFEALNDTAGHAAGDEALRMAARVLQGELRPGDVCGRIGGDEFLLALPDSDAWGAERVVERLRSAVAAAPMRNGRAGMTFSAGIAEFPRDARDQIGLMRLAEGALYRAKRSGRNRCVVYSSFVDAPLSLQEEAERARTAGLANTVYALARAVDLKDGYTHQHSARVAQYAAVLAREFGMSEEEIDQIRTAGILHDVGKVGVADAVLLKPARLTDDEFLEMQRHSTLGRDIVAGAGMPEIAEWVLYLHERWDGRGYPREARGRRHPARQPRARRRRRVRGDDLLAPVPARHGGREGARRAREVRRQAVRPRRRARGWSSSSARARSRSARSASWT